ncbi:MAG TPA: DUF1638 domain-containing protein [Anaerovoracaceae bacterium]|nr:DUF1638 domain-containing protein [Anaerovoracaceae bacterium]
MLQNIVIIACSIFKYELDHLQNTSRLNIPVVYLNSMLHMKPKELQILLDAKIEEFQNFRIILMFGDCHARMVDYEKNPNIVRSQGINCAEIILGSEKYRKIRSDGAFILLPEWTERWKEAFIDDMGFKTSKMATPFMKEMHKKIVYVDTGFQAKNDALFEEISDFLGLPIEIYSSSIDELENVVSRLIEESDMKK